MIGKAKEAPSYIVHLDREEPIADTENVNVVHYTRNIGRGEKIKLKSKVDSKDAEQKQTYQGDVINISSSTGE